MSPGRSEPPIGLGCFLDRARSGYRPDRSPLLPGRRRCALERNPHLWGESPCAYVELHEGASATEQELIEHCRAQMAHDKAPRKVVFGPLPKTSTGKIQKYVLRQRAGSKTAIE